MKEAFNDLLVAVGEFNDKTGLVSLVFCILWIGGMAAMYAVSN